MTFAIQYDGIVPSRDRVLRNLVASFERTGARLTDETDGIQFVLNLTDPGAPRPYRRRSHHVFVISLVALDAIPTDIQSVCYSTLVRTFSNLVVCVTPPVNGSANHEIYFTTPEAGFYHLPYEPDRVFERVRTIACAHYAMENEFSFDLPERLWRGGPAVEALIRYGRELDALGVLPLPFPLREVLSEQDRQHLYRIFGLTGISYGNLSTREPAPELGAGTFWMTARGVNKAALERVGADILFVKGFDFERGTACISQPPKCDPHARVSVDAVEHAMIYSRYPSAGAIVHVHAWMDGILCTRQNSPCGTREIAQEVADLLARTDDPACAVVGLKNHGITITGGSLEEIFCRVRGVLRTQVPMFA